MVSTYIDYRIKTEIDKYGLQPEECKRKNNRKGMPVYRDHWDDGAFRTLAQQVIGLLWFSCALIADLQLWSYSLEVKNNKNRVANTSKTRTLVSLVGLLILRHNSAGFGPLRYRRRIRKQRVFLHSFRGSQGLSKGYWLTSTSLENRLKNHRVGYGLLGRDLFTCFQYIALCLLRVASPPVYLNGLHSFKVNHRFTG